MPQVSPLKIFVVSDATGAMAESVVMSVLVHFKHHRFGIIRFPFTRSAEKIEEVVASAQEDKAVIVFTLVSSQLREMLLEKGRQGGLVVVDVMGPLIQIFSNLLSEYPEMKPGVFRNTDEDTYRVVEAIHFTLRHDDGQGMESIDQADLIILGVSRTGKTPTSVYLSAKRLKVANVPIIKGVPFPDELIRMPVKKVGFKMSPERLAQLRLQRMSRFPDPSTESYTSLAHILAEQEYCESIYRRIPALLTIDVTNRSVEEVSEWITRKVL